MDIGKEIKNKANPGKAAIYQKFFKTGKGEYGEGDKFLGLSVPEQRGVAKKHINIPLEKVEKIIYSSYHEFRLTGLLILAYKYGKADGKEKQEIVDFYLRHKGQGNNWDLVDCVADKILGKHLLDKDKKILYGLAESESLWDRRISIIASFEFIKNNRFDDTLRISRILLKDKHDLIHKAVGWMLREVGKRDLSALKKFLKDNYSELPRTTLRYAIERFPEKERKEWLRGAR